MIFFIQSHISDITSESVTMQTHVLVILWDNQVRLLGKSTSTVNCSVENKGLVQKLFCHKNVSDY